MRSILLAACVLAGQGLAFQPLPAPERSTTVIKIGSGSFLGVGVAEIDAERAKALNLREERGVEITRVEDDGPASKGGVKTGDVVLEYNGQRVEGLEQFVRLVRETPIGREVRLSISRNGAPLTVIVTTGSRKSWSSRGEPFGVEAPRIEFPDGLGREFPRVFSMWRGSALGVEVETLEPQLAQYFGVKEGALIKSVAKGSPAEKAGLKAGDVVVKMDGVKIVQARDVSSAVRGAKGKLTAMVIMRERREMSLNVPVGDDHAEALAAPR